MKKAKTVEPSPIDYNKQKKECQEWQTKLKKCYIQAQKWTTTTTTTKDEQAGL